MSMRYNGLNNMAHKVAHTNISPARDGSVNFAHIHIAMQVETDREVPVLKIANWHEEKNVSNPPGV